MTRSSSTNLEGIDVGPVADVFAEASEEVGHD